jgi:hypothetical protein
MTKTALAPSNHPLYCLADLIEKRRAILRYARSFPPGAERNQHRQIAASLRVLFRNRNWLANNTNQG